MNRIGVPPGVRIVRAEPYEDETDDVSQFADCLLSDWIVKERRTREPLAVKGRHE